MFASDTHNLGLMYPYQLLVAVTKKKENSVGLNSIYFETIEKQYKYYTNLSCHGLCLLAVWPGKVGRGGRRRRDRVQ